MNILGICDDGDILSVFRVANIVILIIKIVVPIILLVSGMVTFMKAISDKNDDLLATAKKALVNKCIAALCIFFVPTIVSTIITVGGEENQYKECLESATDEGIANAYISTLDELVSKAESTLLYNDYYNAYGYLGKAEDKTLRENYKSRLDVVYKDIQARIEAEKAKNNNNNNDNDSVSGDGSLDIPDNSSSTGDASCNTGCVSSEPDPSAALNCWPDHINSSNFTYPKDSATGKPLGAWPKNASSIPTQLTGYKTYQGDKVILPTTPSNGKYGYVYEHNGIDIMASFGTPVYSPVDGTLLYSEWGHTVNKSGNETAYTVTIKMDGSITIDGKTVDTFFLTHMSGIRYRCSWGGCNRTVKKGELIGFTGNAAGSTCGSAGWAPHLHMTVYPNGNYNAGLTTVQTEKIYGLKDGAVIEAGG